MHTVFKALLLLTLLAACSAGPGLSDPPEPSGDAWQDLLARPAQALDGSPLPIGEASPIDGLYGRLDNSPPLWWRCLRCAEYRPAGGLWRMMLDRGVVRLYYEVKDWVTIATFHVEGDRLFISNDLICTEVGEYRWHLEDGKLSLELIEDPCNF